MRINYSEELIATIDKYNNHLQSVADKILDLKINLDETEVKKEVLDDRCDRLSVINSVKSRRDTEDLLRNVVDEYGYILERELRKDK